MLSFVFLLLLSILVSVDAFAIGFLFGLKRIRIPLIIIMLIALFSSFIIFFSMGIGHLLGELISTSIISVFAGVILIVIGVYNFFSEMPLYRRSYFIMVALLMNVDSIGYGIQAGLADRSFWFSPLAGLIIFVAFILGIIYGHETKNRFIVRYMSIIPGLVFILLGLSKLLF